MTPQTKENDDDIEWYFLQNPFCNSLVFTLMAKLLDI